MSAARGWSSAGWCVAALLAASNANAQTRPQHQQLALDIFKELVEINTVTLTGDTERAAEAMAVRMCNLHARGFQHSL